MDEGEKQAVKGIRYSAIKPVISNRRLEMNKFKTEKKLFLETVLPEWIKTGKEREAGYDKK